MAVRRRYFRGIVELIGLALLFGLNGCSKVGSFLQDKCANDNPNCDGPGASFSSKGGKAETEGQELLPGEEYVEVELNNVGSSRVDLQACKLEYSIVSPK